MSRSRGWTLTINNWTQADYDNFMLKAEDCKYAVVGKEVGESGTPHLQCYVYYDNARHFDTIRKLFPGAHVEAAKGNAQQNDDYCSKEGDVTRIGTIPRQGKRSDIDVVREIIEETGSMSQVVQQAPSYQACKMAEMILKYNEKPRTYGRRRVIWHWGDTGTGKTFAVFKQHPDVFTPLSFKWWDGYDGHEVVLLDDIRGDYCKFHEILMLTGERPFRVETKGGSRQAIYDVIYITSPFHPTDLWHTIEDKSQLLDRISEIRHFEGASKRHRSVDTEVGGNTNPDFLEIDGTL